LRWLSWRYAAPPGGSIRIRLLRRGTARDEDRLAIVELGVDAREALGARETREVAWMLVHPRTEPLPERARFGIGESSAVEESTEGHDDCSYTSARGDVTPTSRWVLDVLITARASAR
jgi:hypothetical protein